MGLRVKNVRNASGSSYHLYYLDGKHAPGVTTVVNGIGSSDGLVNWATELTARYAFRNRETLATLDEAEYIDLVSKASERERDAAARAGVEVHTLAHALLSDEPVQVPEHLTGYVRQTIDFLERWGVEDVLAERPVGNRRHWYAGRFDLIARLRDGSIRLLDYKTGRSVWRTVGLQLAGYRFAEFYLDDDDQEQELPEVDACGVVHIGSDSWELYPVQAGVEEFRDFVRAVSLYRFNKRRDVLGDALDRPDLADVLTHSGSDLL